MASEAGISLRRCVLAAVLGALLCAACSTISPASPVPPSVVIPSLVPTFTQSIVVSTRMTALLEGTFESEGPCLRVADPEGHEVYTLVWPADFRYTFDGKTLVVEDTLLGGSKSWNVGDPIEIGGGEVATLNTSVSDSVPDECVGPYWVFGGWLRN